MKQKTQVDLQPLRDFLGTQIKQSRYLERADTELLIRMVQDSMVDVKDTLDDYRLSTWSAQVLSREADHLENLKRKLEGILEVCE